MLFLVKKKKKKKIVYYEEKQMARFDGVKCIIEALIKIRTFCKRGSIGVTVWKIHMDPRELCIMSSTYPGPICWTFTSNGKTWNFSNRISLCRKVMYALCLKFSPCCFSDSVPFEFWDSKKELCGAQLTFVHEWRAKAEKIRAIFANIAGPCTALRCAESAPFSATSYKKCNISIIML